MIIRKKDSFYLETFVGKYDQKYLGRIITDKNNIKLFITSLKQPRKHYYFKGQGYPINKELIDMLLKINVKYIIIPEQEKLPANTLDLEQPLKTYIAETKQYRNGNKVKEPHVEEQRVIPLKQLKEIQLPEKEIKKILY